ncbi:hypothetical protein BC830DRAFT_50930 [Chytriomyces sp. MP71]|nr:hypothetical protein BC830DRAFT_50930 [Chytriomyces sp. MP71]
MSLEPPPVCGGPLGPHSICGSLFSDQPLIMGLDPVSGATSRYGVSLLCSWGAMQCGWESPRLCAFLVNAVTQDLPSDTLLQARTWATEVLFDPTTSDDCFHGTDHERRQCGFYATSAFEAFCALRPSEGCCQSQDQNGSIGLDSERVRRQLALEAITALPPSPGGSVQRQGLSVPAIAGISAAALLLVGLILWLCCHITKRRSNVVAMAANQGSDEPLQVILTYSSRSGDADIPVEKQVQTHLKENKVSVPSIAPESVSATIVDPSTPSIPDIAHRSFSFVSSRFSVAELKRVSGRISTRRSRATNKSSSTALSDHAGKVLRARRSHIPLHDDELAIAVGEDVLVEEEFDDGWAHGLNLNTGANGFFQLAGWDSPTPAPLSRSGSLASTAHVSRMTSRVSRRTTSSSAKLELFFNEVSLGLHALHSHRRGKAGSMGVAMRVVFPYKAARGDELTLSVGEEVAMVTAFEGDLSLFDRFGDVLLSYFCLQMDGHSGWSW